MQGYGKYREAVAVAIRDLGMTVLMIDDVPSTPDAPRAACLRLVDEADLVVLLTGDRYGDPLPPSDVSATHQEFREAQRLRKPVLVFLHDGVDETPNLQVFRAEAEDWAAGALRSLYSTPEELRSAVTSSVHRLLQDHARGAPDHIDLAGSAAALIDETAPDRSRHTQRNALAIGFSPGPRQTILRPAEVENRAEELGLALVNERVMNLADGCRTEVTPQSVRLFNDTLSITVSSIGEISIELSLEPDRRVDSFARQMGAIVEEDVVVGLEVAFRAATTLLDVIDSTRLLSWCGVAASVTSRDYGSWTTRSELAASPNSMGMSMTQRPGTLVMLEVQQRSGLSADRGATRRRSRCAAAGHLQVAPWSHGGHSRSVKACYPQVYPHTAHRREGVVCPAQTVLRGTIRYSPEPA